MNLYEYTVLKEKFHSNNAEITKTELFDFKKTNMELFYRDDIDENLVLLDDYGRFRRIVRNYEKFSEHINALNIAKEEDDNIVINDYSSNLLYNLLSVTPLIKDFEFDFNNVFAMSDLELFAKTAIDLKADISTWLEVDVRKDIEKNPIRFLSNILKIINLKHVKVGSPKTVKGKKIYYYKLDDSSYKQMCSIVSKRSVNKWVYLNNKYNFEYDEDQLMYLEYIEEKANFYY